MSHPAQVKIPATYIRGDTSKGVFFHLQDLSPAAQQPGAARDALPMRVIDNPDPYGKQIDGIGGATSGTGKMVILSKSMRPDHDVDYLFGQVPTDKSFVDWSGNYGNLFVAVGPFAISDGLIDANQIPQSGAAIIRIQQASIGRTIIVHVPITNGAVQETGNFELDSVIFPAAEVQLEFLDPAAEEGGDGGDVMFPTDNLIDGLEVPGVGALKATMINTNVPTIFINAEATSYTGIELQDAVNGDARALAVSEVIHTHGVVHMGPIKSIEEAATRQHTSKTAFAAPPKDYVASSGKKVGTSNMDLLVRALSMGKLHHVTMGMAAVAIGTVATIPGTFISLVAGGGERGAVRFGHPSDTLRVGAKAKLADGEWTATKAIVSRNACALMEGWVCVSG